MPSRDFIRGGVGGMLTIIKASVVGSALMLLASCTSYYQTPCGEGRICECVRYTTIYRSWVDCRPPPLNRPAHNL